MQNINKPLHKCLRAIFRRKWLLVVPAFGSLILGLSFCIHLGLLAILVGLFIGTAIGGALIFMFGSLDKSFLDGQEAGQYLNTPLLGAISKIVTGEES